MNNVVKQAEAKVVTAAKRSVLLDMAAQYGMEPVAFEAVVRSTCLPRDKKTNREATREEFAAFLLVAKEYNLNPLTREIFGFLTKSGGVQPVVSVDGWANLLNSHPAFDGMEFEDHTDGDELIAVTCRMYRKDRSHPTAVTEYMKECRRATEPWDKWPRRMLRHKAFIQTARYAFGFAGIADPDEAERMAADLATDVTPSGPRPSIGDAFAEFGRVELQAHDPETGEIEDEGVPQQAQATASASAPMEKWEQYVARWEGYIDAAVPRQSDQIQKTWDDERKVRAKINWPDEETDRNLERKVKAALELLRAG